MRNSEIIICKGIQLDKGYKNVLSYAETEMLTLCRSKKIGGNTDYSFIKENTIRVADSYDVCIFANYIAFQNKSYSNKWFFAFVTDVRLANNGAVDITYEIDAFATWYGYYNPKECYVLREHVADDTVGANLVPEGLETGDYINNQSLYYTNQDDEKGVVVGSLIDLEGDLLPVAGGIYNGVFSGVRYYYFSNFNNLKLLLEQVAEEGKLDSILFMFMTYKNYLQTDGGNIITESDNSKIDVWDINLNTISLDGYVPRNKKLLTYPYSYNTLSNNAGATSILKNEYWSNLGVTQRIRIESALTSGMSIRAIPINYNTPNKNPDITEYNQLESVTLGKHPAVSWNSDQFTNWLVQNSASIASSGLMTALAIGGGVAATVATGGAAAPLAVGAVAASLGSSAVGSITSNLSSVYEHSLSPKSAEGNVNAGDVIFSSERSTFIFNNMTIRKEFAKIIDDYFTRFGYKVNALKTPNIKTRVYWNFVQIGEGEDIVIGDIPPKYADVINEIYRKGATIWHDHSYIGNYVLEN